MLPIRWEPFQTITRDPFFRAFEDLFPRFGMSALDDDRGGVRVYAEEDGYVIEAPVPGYGPEHLQIWVEAEGVRIEGERRAEPRDGESEGAVRGRIKKLVSLPLAQVDRDRVEAKVEHGIVTVRLPRAEQHKPRRIEVQTAGGFGKKIAESARRLFKKDEQPNES